MLLQFLWARLRSVSNRAATIVTTAPTIPGATLESDAWLTAANPRKEFMMPQTVPNRPM